MNNPIRKVAAALAVLFVALFVNLNLVQVVKSSDYRNNSENRRVLLNEYASPRGQIVVGGTAVAESKRTKNDELKYQRVYPQGKIYAPVTGYYSFIYGASSIEDAENDILSGDSSKLFTSRLANILTGRNPRGGSVELTLNKAAQVAAYNGMKVGKGFKRGAVVALDPTTGEILALVSTPSWDPNELASHDSAAIVRAYKAYQHAAGEPMLNRAIRQNYPAGSIFKIIDAAAALKLGIKPNDRIAAPNGFWPLDPARKSACPASLSAPCVENYAGETCDNGSTATLAFAFAKSCNTAFAALAVNRIGSDALAARATMFGFDPPYAGSTPPDFCNPPAFTIPLAVCRSSPGSVADMSDMAALAQTSFGQRDVRITPLQAAMLSAAVANGGTLYKPYLVKDELRPDLSVLSTTPSKQLLHQVIDPTLDSQLIQLMEGVVSNPEGTGGPANITDLGPDVVVGGKTGTADVGTTSGSKVEPDAWFTGFAMVHGVPKIAVAVVMENAGTSGNEVTGGQAAGPVAKAVMEAYLRSPGVMSR